MSFALWSGLPALEASEMFRFTIRELVLLTLVVAMGVAWWLDRFNQEVRLRKRDAYWERGWAMEHRWDDPTNAWQADFQKRKKMAP
jgi:hypothetical protein